MKTKNLLMLFALAGLMIFASCKKDEGTPEPLTADEAEVALTGISTNYSSDLDNFENSTEAEAMDMVDGLGLPFMSGVMKAPLNQKTINTEILKVYNPSKGLKGDGTWDIYMTENHGTWQYVEGVWTKTSTTPDNKIVVIFSYNGGNNNATLTFYNYETKTISVGGESMKYMSSLSCKLEITGMTNPVMSWDYTGSLAYTTSSFSMKMKFVYNLGQFTYTQAASIYEGQSNSGGKAVIYMLEEIKKNSEVLRGSSYEITYISSQEGYEQSIIAKFRVKNIIVKWVITIDQNTNTSGNPDDYMDISVWTADGAKVADLIFKLEGDYYVAYFVFADGTEVKADTLLSEDLYWDITYFSEDFMDFKK